MTGFVVQGHIYSYILFLSYMYVLCSPFVERNIYYKYKIKIYKYEYIFVNRCFTSPIICAAGLFIFIVTEIFNLTVKQVQFVKIVLYQPPCSRNQHRP